MIKNYNKIKENELRNIHDEFSFSREVQTAVKSELWRDKTALWTILSGACDDAAKQCYIKINNMKFSSVIIISFHEQKYNLKYYFKRCKNE